MNKIRKIFRDELNIDGVLFKTFFIFTYKSFIYTFSSYLLDQCHLKIYYQN